ncbi:MAG: alcohol dehydrogenase catalytic domain-containing protein [Rhodoblastus sp.]
MKAAVLTAINQPLEILDLELDPPKAGEARVKMKASGVCMSDWHMMNGDWPAKLPLVPGHEAAGVVTEVGPSPSHVSVGDHVIFSFSSHCGHCRYCNSGKSVLCNGHSAPGFLMPDGTTRMKFKAEPVYQMARIGTFREEVVCSTENLVPIRKDLPWTIAAIIGCSVATGVGAVYRAAKVEAGSSVVVVGCGGVGLNIVQGAKLVGAGKIIAVDLLDNKLDYAKQFGATHDQRQDGNVEARARDHRWRRGLRLRRHRLGSDRAADRRLPLRRRPRHHGRHSLGAGEGGHLAGLHGLPGEDAGVLLLWLDPARHRLPDPCRPLHGREARPRLLISRTYTLDQINEGFDQLRKGGVARGVVVFD